MARSSFLLCLACTIAISWAAEATDVVKKASLKFLTKSLVKPELAVFDSLNLVSKLSAESEQKSLGSRTGKVETIEMCKTFGFTKCMNEDHTMPNGDILRFVVEKKTPEEEAIEVVLSVVTTILVSVICAHLYNQRKVWPIAEKGDPDSLKEWTSGLFDCSQDLYGFFCACCCMPIRWGDTMSMIGLATFWAAFGALLGLECMELIPYMGYTWIGTCAGLAYFRTQFRAIFQIPGSLGMDCLVMCCCTPCAVAQEARHVERAAVLGHDIVSAQKPLRDGVVSQGAPKPAKSAGKKAPEAVEEGSAEGSEVEPEPDNAVF